MMKTYKETVEKGKKKKRLKGDFVPFCCLSGAPLGQKNVWRWSRESNPHLLDRLSDALPTESSVFLGNMRQFLSI
jgi:hypothetical protein